MSVADAVDFFTEAAVAKILKPLDDVGLNYLTLGQPLSTLSGANASGSSSLRNWARKDISMCSTSPRRACT